MPADEARLITIRAWGDYACMTRPELKAERVSYSVLTPSAARGILEAIFYEPQIAYVIHEIGVVRRGRWFSFRRNEVSKVVSLRAVGRAMAESTPLESIQAGGGAADGTQRGMLALADVEYVITAEVRLTIRAQPPRDSLAKYAGMIERRARSGRCFHRPYLGVREFAANFDWVDDPSTVQFVDPWPAEDLGIMLYDVFDPQRRTIGVPVPPAPVYFQAKIEDNRMDCHPDRVTMFRRPGGPA